MPRDNGCGRLIQYPLPVIVNIEPIPQSRFQADCADETVTGINRPTGRMWDNLIYEMKRVINGIGEWWRASFHK